MKKPNKKNETKPLDQKQKPMVPKTRKQPAKENESLAPKAVESKVDAKKSMIQKIEEKMSVKKSDTKLDLSKVVDKVLVVFIALQVLGLVYLLVK
jgi:hypothetical protein